MFIDNGSFTVGNYKNRALSEAYLNEYINSASLIETVASPEYRRYMTCLLIQRGILFQKADVLEFLKKATLEQLFTDKFKHLFLYDTKRVIKGAYPDVKSLREMNVIGNFDLLSSMITAVNAKLFPIYKGFAETTKIEDLTKEVNEFIKDKIHYPYETLDIVPQDPESEDWINQPIFDLVPSEMNPVIYPWFAKDLWVKMSEDTETGIIIYRKCTIEDFVINTEAEDNLDIIKLKRDIEYYVADWEGGDPHPSEPEEYPMTSSTGEEYREYVLEWIEEQTEKVNATKHEKMIPILNKLFYNQLCKACNAIKILLRTDLYSVFDIIRSAGVDRHYRALLSSVYEEITDAFSMLYYVLNVSQLFETEGFIENTKNRPVLICYPYEIIKYFVKEHLSSVDELYNLIGIKPYFNKVMNDIFTENFYENYRDMVQIKNPIIDNITKPGQTSSPIEQVLFDFAENIFNFRTLYERCDFDYQNTELEEISYKNLFGLFILGVVQFCQILFMESYLSKNRNKPSIDAMNLVKTFAVNPDRIVTWEEILTVVEKNSKEIVWPT